MYRNPYETARIQWKAIRVLFVARVFLLTFQDVGDIIKYNFPYGGLLKWWYPTTMGFPTKNNHFGVF